MTKVTAQELVLAKDIMSRPVYRVTVGTKAPDAAAFFLRHGISGAPVIGSQGRPVGVLSLTDLGRALQRLMVSKAALRRTLEGLESPPEGFPLAVEDLQNTTVGSLMTPGLFTVFPEATLEEVVRTMASQKIHRVFVISEEGELEGVITTMDVLRWIDRKQSTERIESRMNHHA